MTSSEQILEDAAKDGSIDITEWPRVLETVLQRLHEIVYNDFSLPAIPPTVPLVPSTIDPEVIAASPARGLSPGQPPALSQLEDTTDSIGPSSQSSSTTNKENTAPITQSLSRPPVPAFSASGDALTSTPQVAISGPQELPSDLLSSFHSSTNILQKSFSNSPPYTIQRLAELVLYPRRHYRYLPPYLAALDRVVSVSSPVSDFPLPQLALNSTDGGFLTNGEASNGSSEREGLSSDESLGGALLTPIPWLRKETSLADAASNAQIQDHDVIQEGIENGEGSSNGDGAFPAVNGLTGTGHGSPTEEEKANMTTEQTLRAEGAVTQGELLRQEQEAGVIPVAQAGTRRSIMTGSAAVGRDLLAPSIEEVTMPEDHPHARGPDVIGMEDMGPQDGGLGVIRPLDMEAAVGRSRSKSPQPPEAAPEEVKEDKTDDVKPEEPEHDSKDVEMSG